MKCVHLTMMAFCHILIASAVLYLNTFTAALPIADTQAVAQSKQPKIENNEFQKQQAASEPQQIKPAAALAVAPSTVLVESLKAAQVEQPKAAFAAEVSGKSSPIESVPKQVEAEQKQAPPSVEQPVGQKEIKSSAQQQEAPPSTAAVTPKQIVQKESTVDGKKDATIEKQPEKQTANKSPIKPDEQQTIVESPVVAKVAPVVAQPAPSSEIIAPTVVAQNSPEIIKPVEPQAVVAAAPKLPQPAALVAEQKQQSVVSAKSDSPVVKEEKSVVVKEQAPVAAASPTKSDRKISVEQPEPVKEQQQPAKVADVAQPQNSQPAPVEVVADQQSVVVARTQANNAALSPVVKGGLGPLHLLATTLCSYQPDRPVADENLNQLYSRRAHLRKSLFEFMSLKFTNLEKLSSRLGYGLQVVPVKSIGDPLPASRTPAGGIVSPSHGWPVVGKCTAHDLKLMGEAAWCEAEQLAPTQAAGPVAVVAADQDSKSSGGPVVAADEQPAKITSNQHMSRAQAARSIQPQQGNSFLPSPEQSSVISKLLHVGDIKDAPLVESTIYNLNLTQQQLATLEAHATSTRECRRNALRYTKALFNHLAEDQRNVSESWPQLYALIQTDDCARKRMIDIITALSGFRTDTTSIRRDNLEFAFAMDDLRTKVLDNEVNVALTFDKQFIEVEQFLQQSVRLMLSNIDPNRAKLTSMRYRSLMYGNVAGNADDQCIELHQRLLAQSYPTDCNPNQFGQLPDVLRMTASSLELWSVEKEISLHTAKGGTFDYPNTNSAGQQKVREDVNECIANLVSS